jgi:hypothetical protein
MVGLEAAYVNVLSRLMSMLRYRQMTEHPGMLRLGGSHEYKNDMGLLETDTLTVREFGMSPRG